MSAGRCVRPETAGALLGPSFTSGGPETVGRGFERVAVGRHRPTLRRHGYCAWARTSDYFFGSVVVVVVVEVPSRASRRSSRPVRRAWRRSVRPVRRSCRRSVRPLRRS
jgi:hypothetical protein